MVRRFSRRDILKGAALGAGLIGTGLVGCGDEEASSPPTATPEPTTVRGPTPTAPERAAIPSEVALIDRYFTNDFFPRQLVVKEGVPLVLYFTRHDQEHVNRIRIEPFVDDAPVMAGDLRILRFTPDRAGEYQIVNVGHGFAAALVVVATDQEVIDRRIVDGVQEAALIFDGEESRTYPGTIVGKKDIPVRLYATGLTDDHWVGIEPFVEAPSLEGPGNVSSDDTVTIDFTPDRLGEFTIRCDVHGETARLLIVEEAPMFIAARPWAYGLVSTVELRPRDESEPCPCSASGSPRFTDACPCPRP